MRPVRPLLIYVAVVFGGGALLAPWLYLLTQWAAGHWLVLAPLAANPFHRFVVRSILGLAFLGLWPLLRSCHMLNRRALGFAATGQPFRQTATGLALGFSSLALVALLALLCGGRVLNLSHTSPEIFHYLRDTIAASFFVPILEELIFRAALFGILRKTLPLSLALIISSAVYAAVHFLQKASPPDHVTWLSGLQILPNMFKPPPDGLPFIPAFFTLFTAGMILALTYQRTGNLFQSMGLHAGWIFWLKSYRFLTTDASHASHGLWGSDKLIDGWLPLIVLAALFFVMLRQHRPSTFAPSPVR
jgi:uncharacterized protein